MHKHICAHSKHLGAGDRGLVHRRRRVCRAPPASLLLIACAGRWCASSAFSSSSSLLLVLFDGNNDVFVRREPLTRNQSLERCTVVKFNTHVETSLGESHNNSYKLFKPLKMPNEKTYFTYTHIPPLPLSLSLPTHRHTTAVN